MRSKFVEQLGELHSEMVLMGNQIAQSIKRAIIALKAGDKTKAKAIMEGDTSINHQQKKIESICFNLLIQQQPVAKDLRAITAALKMVTDMERIGDHAADISQMNIMLNHPGLINKFEHIVKMASETMLMLNRSLEAYVNEDINQAKEVIKHDDVVDNLFNQAKSDIINLILKEPQCGEEAVDLLLIAKYFERIGDHTTNIAEWVVYAFNKEDI